MRVLLTRPRADSEPLAADLAARGIDSLVEPMLDIVFRAGAAPALDDVQALLFTSANGVRAFAAASGERGLTVFAVGDATARAAGEAGFTRIASAGGDVRDLAALVASRLRPEDGALLHVAGSKVAGDLAGTLRKAGFTVRRAMLYESRTARAFSPEATAALADGTIDAVLIFSPRTAHAFVSLARQAGLDRACRQITALCLSPAVAAAANGLSWRAVRVAAAPTRAALLDLLPADAGTSNSTEGD